MREYLEKAGLYFVSLVGYTFLSLVTMTGGIYLVRAFHPKTFLAERIVGTVVMFLTIAIGMFVYAYRMGHKQGSFSIRPFLISYSMTVFFHFVFAAVLQFSVWAGPANGLGHILWLGGDLLTSALPIRYTLMTLWLFYLLYGAVILAGEYVGARKRNRERSALHLG